MIKNWYASTRKGTLSTSFAKKALCTFLAAGMITVPAYAAETEALNTAMTETEELVKLHGDTECELKDGIFTIRIKALDTDDKDFGWQAYRGDKGDASLTEVLTETDMEEGLAYCGSFRGLENESGEDVIRLVHTNGFYTDGYLDFNVKVEDGKITEQTGGGEGYGATGEDLAPVLAGDWVEEDGSLCMEISVSDDNALDFVISDGSGKDGKTTYYTMTAYYDCVQETLIYKNGTEHVAEITDGSETEAETEEKEGTGTGKFGIIEDGEEVAIAWQDDTFGHEGTGNFVKAE